MQQAYVCPKPGCGRKVIRQTFGTENGRHETWWACTNPTESHFYGLPWREKDWEYSFAASEDPNLEPWPDEEPFKGMIAGQERRVTGDEIRTYINEAIPACIIAASLLIAIRWMAFLPEVTRA